MHRATHAGVNGLQGVVVVRAAHQFFSHSVASSNITGHHGRLCIATSQSSIRVPFIGVSLATSYDVRCNLVARINVSNVTAHYQSVNRTRREMRPVSTVGSRPVSLQLAERRGRRFDLTGATRGELIRTRHPAGGADSTCAIYPQRKSFWLPHRPFGSTR